MCQLVLGAGAVEAVGLKTITARHLGEGNRFIHKEPNIVAVVLK